MALSETGSTSNDIIFAGIVTPPKKRPITELSIMDANKDEYVTRHLVDGRIIYCDHRVSVVAGYMSEEVSGLNAFAFMHKDDFRWTMIGLRQSKHLNVISSSFRIGILITLLSTFYNDTNIVCLSLPPSKIWKNHINLLSNITFIMPGG